MHWRRGDRLPLLAVMSVALLLTAGGCGGRGAGLTRMEDPGGRGDSAVAQALGELEAAPAPDGVDPGVHALLTAELARVLAECAPRTGSAAPSDERSRCPLSWDTGTLIWRYYATGDYNQDGYVTINDITPLGQNYQAAVPGDPNSSLACVDGNGDGLITINDITQIGQNFGGSVSKYRAYMSADSTDYPASATGGNGAATLLGEVGFSEAQAPAGERKAFSFTVPSPHPEYYCWVRPVDDAGSEGIASELTQLPGEENQPPVAALSAEPEGGDVPLMVEFDASLSNDPDGYIAKYEWDWTGFSDGWQWYDSGTESVVEHVFDEIGEYTTVVRVTDDKGAMDTAAATVSVTAPGNDPPVAVLAAYPTSGEAPLTVSFDASASDDPDGTIADYEWDLDGDGMYNGPTSEEMLARGKPVTDFLYSHGGNFTAKLRVTDDDDATDTDECTILVSGGVPEWHIYTVVEGEDVYYPQLREVNGRPAIVYYDVPTDALRYIRADDALGTSWTDTTGMICSDFSQWFEFVETDGYPAVIYLSSSGLTFVRAVDPDGEMWGFLVHIDNISEAVYTYGGAVIDGNPAVTYARYGTPPEGYLYRRATTPTGMEWSEPQVVPTGGLSLMYMVEVNGAPALCYEDPDHFCSLSYRRATNAGGSAWYPPINVDPNVGVGFYPKLEVVDGKPAILYWDLLPESVTPLYFIRATDADGTGWGSRELVDSLQDSLYSPDLAVVDGRPAACYVGGPEPRTLYFKHALDSAGADWPATAETIASEAQYTETSLADIGGHPGIAFSQYGEEQWIDFAIYY